MESNEDPKLKKEASYTYWVNNDPNFFKEGLKPETAPQKLEDPKLNSSYTLFFLSVFIKFSKFRSQNSGHSAWNTAGTWFFFKKT